MQVRSGNGLRPLYKTLGILFWFSVLQITQKLILINLMHQVRVGDGGRPRDHVCRAAAARDTGHPTRNYSPILQSREHGTVSLEWEGATGGQTSDHA